MAASHESGSWEPAPEFVAADKAEPGRRRGGRPPRKGAAPRADSEDEGGDIDEYQGRTHKPIDRPQADADMGSDGGGAEGGDGSAARRRRPNPRRTSGREDEDDPSWDIFRNPPEGRRFKPGALGYDDRSTEEKATQEKAMVDDVRRWNGRLEVAIWIAVSLLALLYAYKFYRDVWSAPLEGAVDADGNPMADAGADPAVTRVAQDL